MTASALRALAPAKINLGLFLGPVREEDGRHELVSVMQSISLADELTLQEGQGDADEVICPGVEGENLAAGALAAFREATGWDGPPQRLTIHKRIPVAAGLGGGSADAACALRLARAASGLGDEALLVGIAVRLGADVPAQVAPGRWLAGGAGERLTRLPAPRHTFGVLVLPSDEQLSTAAVYAEADRLELGRPRDELARLAEEISAALARGAALPAALELAHNDLQRAAVSLCPGIVEGLREARDQGARLALVSGSGPTVLGVYPDPPGTPGDGPARAEIAAASLRERTPPALWALPVDETYGRPLALNGG